MTPKFKVGEIVRHSASGQFRSPTFVIIACGIMDYGYAQEVNYLIAGVSGNEQPWKTYVTETEIEGYPTENRKQ